MEAEILIEIKDSEKKSDEIVERAKKESESIINEAMANSSKQLNEKEAEIRKLQDKRILDFRDKSRLIKEEKHAEGRNSVKQLKTKSERNIPKAVEFVMKKFEELV